MGHPGFFIRDEDRGVVQKSKAPPFSHKTGEEWGTRLYAGIVSDLLITLYRPVGQGELELIRENGFREFPPRLPEQPIFYPVLTEEYATQIARDWNTKDERSGFAGFVLRFSVRTEFLRKYEVHVVGSSNHREYWIPAAELPQFNSNIVGGIEVIAEFERNQSGG
jgi:hypothetical protein